MADSDVSLEALLRSYERSLVVRVQLLEFAQWGASMTDSFNRMLQQHRDLERLYIEQLRERRRREDLKHRT